MNDDVEEEAAKCFSERQLVDLTISVISLNGWTRLSIAFRRTAGTYRVTSTEVIYQASITANRK